VYKIQFKVIFLCFLFYALSKTAFLLQGSAMVQAVIYRPLTANDWFQL